MKFYGKSQDVCKDIIEIFKNGDIPDKLSKIFIHRNDKIPSAKWSYLNRMIMIINNTNDARTFKQWNSVGRKVKKGSKAFFILGPCLKKYNDEGEEKYILYGFKGISVFKIEDTEIFDENLWENKSGVDKQAQEKIKNLPLKEIAEKWELDIDVFDGKSMPFLGYYKHNEKIAIGVENLSVWCHELVHAADHKNGTLVENKKQEISNEIVAEIGSNVLLKVLGRDKDVDLGSAWEYVKHYSQNDSNKAIKMISKLIDRICSSVDLILKESDEYLNS